MVGGGVARARVRLNLAGNRRGNGPCCGGSDRAHSEHGDDPVRGIIGVEIEVVKMVRNSVTSGADRVAGRTVRT